MQVLLLNLRQKSILYLLNNQSRMAGQTKLESHHYCQVSDTCSSPRGGAFAGGSCPQERQSQDVSALLGWHVLGLPKKTRLTQALDGTMLYSHKKRQGKTGFSSVSMVGLARCHMTHTHTEAEHRIACQVWNRRYSQTR